MRVLPEHFVHFILIFAHPIGRRSFQNEEGAANEAAVAYGQERFWNDIEEI